MILYINACVREKSRTRRLAEYLLTKLGGPVREARLSDIAFPAADQKFLDLRDELLGRGELDHSIFEQARLFAAADIIVVAAPYWDLSFPAALKQYFEQVNAIGVTFTYSNDGIPVGMCRAKCLYYVTTAGGPLLSDEYGFGYVKALAEEFYHIPEMKLIKAEGLDIVGADVEAIMRQTERYIDSLF